MGNEEGGEGKGREREAERKRRGSDGRERREEVTPNYFSLEPLL